MRLFGKKKKDGKGVKEERDIEQVSSSKIKIKVFKAMGGMIRIKKNEYNATEQRDGFGELVSINEDAKHNEDVDFQMDSIYREMQILLDFRTKSRKQKEFILGARIKKPRWIAFLGHL